jgi:hypothetical protein
MNFRKGGRMAITFICPHCKQKAELHEAMRDCMVVSVCTDWIGTRRPKDAYPETVHLETYYDNAERTYECGSCGHEPQFRPEENIYIWVKRHQVDPPEPLKDFLEEIKKAEAEIEAEKEAAMAREAQAVKNVPEDNNANPELLP